ncbi:hypothetical protein AZ09_05060 [Acetobacter aceti 1023]|nr:hypothetical protein AZ09_05060 [Acetobacter aceti 1023]
MKNGNIFGCNFVKGGSFLHTLTRFVHIGHGQQQQNLLPAYAALGNLALKAVAPWRKPVLTGYGFHRHKANIVPVPTHGGFGITQPNPEQHC